MSKYLFQEDDALINGRDPDYRGIYGWWEEKFPGRKFGEDWKTAVGTDEDHGDALVRTLVVEGVEYRVWYSLDGYAVEKPLCPVCNGTGIESSGVCHCGASMEGHSLYDNHSATEMTRPCPRCNAGSASSAPPSTHYVTVEFLRDSGLLQEINRQFLHPLGMAAEVVVEDDGSNPEGMAVIHIQDWTADPEGMAFAKGVMEKEKTERFQKFVDSRREPRVKALGWFIQPPETEMENS